MTLFCRWATPVFVLLSLALAWSISDAAEARLDKAKPDTFETGATLHTDAAEMNTAAIGRDQAAEILIYALSMVGVKYRYGGNSAATGFDCSGFVHHVFAEIAAFALPRNSEAMARQGVKITANELTAGDLVFYNTRSRLNSHVGIYLGNNTFVHAPSRGKSVEIVDMTLAYWQTRFNGARRLIAGAGTPLPPTEAALRRAPTVSAVQTLSAAPTTTPIKAPRKEPDSMPITNGQ